MNQILFLSFCFLFSMKPEIFISIFLAEMR